MKTSKSYTFESSLARVHGAHRLASTSIEEPVKNLFINSSIINPFYPSFSNRLLKEFDSIFWREKMLENFRVFLVDNPWFSLCSVNLSMSICFCLLFNEYLLKRMQNLAVPAEWILGRKNKAKMLPRLVVHSTRSLGIGLEHILQQCAHYSWLRVNENCFVRNEVVHFPGSIALTGDRLLDVCLAFCRILARVWPLILLLLLLLMVECVRILASKCLTVCLLPNWNLRPFEKASAS